MIKRNSFKALGFVEVMIAIVIAGIVSGVFLTMAGRAMKELILTERVETMGRIARDGSNIAQEVANKEKAGLGLMEDEVFPKQPDSCYLPIRDESAPDGEIHFFDLWDDGSFTTILSDEATARQQIVERVGQINNYMYDYYFLAMCIDHIEENTMRVKFWVGDINVKGERTSDTDVKDFIFYSIISI